MFNSYSIVEAHNRFATLMRDLPRVGRVAITHRGRTIAFLLSAEEYKRLNQARPNFWDAYLEFQKQHDVAIEADVFADVRDLSIRRDAADAFNSIEDA